MTIRSWLAAHRSAAATATSGTLVAAVVVTVAITSTGYTAQRVDLDDGTVWVPNGNAQAVGRANPAVLELNTVLRASGDDLEVVQRGGDVLVVDHADATVRILDPADATLSDAIALPPDDASVAFAGERVVIHEAGTGAVWIVPTGELPDFDPSAPVSLSLGLDSVVSVAPDGVLYAYSSPLDEVYRVDAAVTDQVDTRWQAGLGSGSQARDLTSVGDVWAVLDPVTRTVATAGGVLDLSPSIPAGAVALQEPAVTGDGVLIGTADGLLRLAPDASAASSVLGGLAGTPARPYTLDGCEFAAWGAGGLWRDCGAGAQTFQLDGAVGGERDFVGVGDRVVLNDPRRGATWAVQDAGQLIDNWDDLLVDDDQVQPDQNDPDVPPTVDQEQQVPVAVDDEFGARPGRTTVLPVLLNDYDPNADVLVIDLVDPIAEDIGRLDLVTRNQQLQLSLADDAAGTIGFRYTISDGRGGIASATVRVTVRGENENSAPVQVRPTRVDVATGGRVTTQVLGDWIDPDGDAFYLEAASTAEPDQVSFTPGGSVVFADAAEGGDLKSVTLSVTDGAARAGGSLTVGVTAAGELPITIEPWVALATAGQEITIRPMSHVTGGSGPLRLNAVPERAGSRVDPSFEAGTFTFSSDQVRTHYLEFTVTDGSQTATGLVRIDVSAPPDANTRPITVPRTLFVRTLSSDVLDPTATDIDPSGGVLVVTGVTAPGTASGVRAEVLDQRDVRITLTAPLDGRTVDVHYRISNGLADAEGTITVVEIPVPGQLQPPIARDDAATVRVGQVVDVPVLANDEHPDGETMRLLPELARGLPDDAGLLFASGDRLRYLAPETAGDYTAVYSVVGPDGQRSEARVMLSVREEDAATNNAPVPARVTARVLAGESVRIRIPLAAIDPDGDAVQLIGATSNPEKGSVHTVGPNEIEFDAGDYSSGTDEFRYAVVDGLGARAEGTVRVGISPRLDGARNPVANEDAVRVRPGRTVSVQVLANDSDPDGSPLRVVAVAPNSSGTTASVVDESVVDVTPPEQPGTYSVIYTIQNEFGGTSSNFVTVEVDPDAPLAYPVARDSVLTASDVVDTATVAVPVLDNVFFADGDVDELALALVPGYSGGARLLPDQTIEVTVGDFSRIIPFAVSHPDDPGIRSLAFIWVPGYDDTLPQVDRTAALLEVASEATLRIDLDDHVVALGGQGVRLTDSSTVRATHANGADLVVDANTLEFTSADQYFGPASITFEVTDGASPTDPEGRVAILTLPIDVLPRDNQPPVFIGGVVDFEPGQEKELDLIRLTDYPYDDIDELAYEVIGAPPEGFSYVLNGQRLLLRAAEDTPNGSTSSITLGVRDAVNAGRAGRIQVHVVASTRPLVRPVPDTAVTPRGATTTIDVLANDEANNPFPDVPLEVLDIRGIDGASLPDGLSVVPSEDRSQLTVTVADSAAAVDTSLQYQVADATRDPSRAVWGAVTISVQDVPDPVTGIGVTEFGDRLLRVSWTPGQFNNSPIDHYDVTMTSTSGDPVSVTTCTSSVGCALTTPGNGPANAVRLSVVAVNALGASDPAALASPTRSDLIPPPPTGLGWTPLDHGLRVTWAKPADTGGSPIDQYVVTVGDAVQTLAVDPSDPVGWVYSANLQSASIANGSAVGFSVSARNSAPNSLATWNRANGVGIPAGPPTLLGPALSASGSLTDGTTASVSWVGVFGDNGRAIEKFWTVIRSSGSAPSCGASGVENGTPSPIPPTGSGIQQHSAGTTSAEFSGLSANQTYTIWVLAYNGQGCTVSLPVQVTPRAIPGTVTAIAAKLAENAADPIAGDGEYYDFRLDSFDIAVGSADADTFRYRLIGEGVAATESAVTATGSFLTAGTSQYGATIGVQVVGCHVYPEGTLCSAQWSAVFPLGVPVHNSQPGGLAFDQRLFGGTWSWTSIPSGPGYEAVQYRCASGSDSSGWSPMTEVGSCDAGSLSSALRVRITANGGQLYVRTYDPLDFSG